jgi:phenylalanyl-tRNA synthetase beta chain
VLAAELDIAALIGSLTDLDTITPISNYPAIYQDIALVVKEDVPAADIEAAIRSAGGGLLREVTLFDVYRGDQIGVGNKSLAYALTFQAENKTLRDKDADALRTKIVRALEARLGAKLRA